MEKITYLFLLSLSLSALHAECIYKNSFSSQKDLDGWKNSSAAAIQNDALLFFRKNIGDSLIQHPLPPVDLSSRIIRISGEAKGERLSSSSMSAPYHGLKANLMVQSGKKKNWFGMAFPAGSFPWRRFDSIFVMPSDIESGTLYLGLQHAAGIAQLRNLVVESIGRTVDFSPVANMGLADESAGDGVGGWTDQGPGQDGRIFKQGLQSRFFSGIPVFVRTEGKGIVVMKAEKYFPSGPTSIKIPLSGMKAKTLYLMHTLAFAPQGREVIGKIILTDEFGKKQKIDIQTQRDVADWFLNEVQLQNAYPAVQAKSMGKTPAAVYLSRFSVDRNLGKITEISFETKKNSIWLILGTTLSGIDFKLPVRKMHVIKADKQWLPVKRSAGNILKDGSALDLTRWTPNKKTGVSGRVIITPEGHFAFEKKPEQTVRFFVCSLTPNLKTDFQDHQTIKKLVKEIRKSGYNMVRIHFPEILLMEQSKQALEFNPRALDHFDYFIFCLKENGIYLNLDLMTSWLGYTPGNPYAKENADPRKSFKSRIHFEPEIRENWKKGVEKLLCRKNQYTGTRLIDDPVFAMAVAYNEQEYGFWRPFPTSRILPLWHEFLKQRYGTLEKLKQAWGEKARDYTSFEQIPCFELTSRVYENDDTALFLRKTETDTLRWYEKNMRELGYPGPVAGYNCGKNQYYNMIRKNSPFIAMNAYHAHPSKWIQPGSYISQKSAIEERAKLLRDFVAVRQVGKPFIITEYNLVFWNQYRYEQAFVMGAYSAFQNLDALTCHGTPVSFKKEKRILSFGIFMDPIAKATEFLTYFLFMRGDITPSSPSLRIQIHEKDVFRKNGLRGGLPTELSLAALTAGLSIECLGDETKGGKLNPGEAVFAIDKTSSILVSNAGFSSTLDNPHASSERVLAYLRKAKILSAENRSDGRKLFESSTGELLVDTSRNYMQINTPRFQGICGEAGTTAKLNDLVINSMTRKGTLSLVSIDENESIRNASRMMLVYATNALNNGMIFSNSNMNTLQYVGNSPTLLEQGSFTVTIHNRNAEKLRLYPLDLAGNRLKKISPVRISGKQAVFQIDTAKDGATVFFEIQAE